MAQGPGPTDGRHNKGADSVSSKSENRGFVVVTGTSTGIGASTALHLARNGFHIFTGVRRAKDRRSAVRGHLSGVREEKSLLRAI